MGGNESTTDQASSAPGFGTGLDFANVDVLSPAERETLFRWYGETHGSSADDLSLVPFVEFLADNRPGALKRWRAYTEAVGGANASLSQAFVALLYMHYYAIIANEDGVRYEIVAARAWGATRAEVLDTLSYAFNRSGPFGMNAVARAATELLADWQDVDDADREGAAATILWADEPTPLPTPQPATGFWADNYPQALRALAERRAGAFVSLPQQAGSLFTLFLGVATVNSQTCRQAVESGRAYGVERSLLAESALWGAAYGGEPGLELAARELADL